MTKPDDTVSPGAVAAAGDQYHASYRRPLMPGVDTTHQVILYLEDITVEFDGFKALNALTMEIGVGELRCIIGPNGAGKTTMMDVITGKTRPSSGSAFFGQTLDLSKLTEAQIAQQASGASFRGPPCLKCTRCSRILSWH